MQAVQLTRKSLLDVGANVFGVVLNNVDLAHKQYGGYYQQYYYYRSGYSSDDEAGSKSRSEAKAKTKAEAETKKAV